jgi:hypothetical protein
VRRTRQHVGRGRERLPVSLSRTKVAQVFCEVTTVAQVTLPVEQAGASSGASRHMIGAWQ